MARVVILVQQECHRLTPVLVVGDYTLRDRIAQVVVIRLATVVDQWAVMAQALQVVLPLIY